METFHLYHLARLSVNGTISAAACAIVLAQRKKNDFLTNEDKHTLEKQAGRACLEALVKWNSDGKVLFASLMSQVLYENLFRRILAGVLLALAANIEVLLDCERERVEWVKDVQESQEFAFPSGFLSQFAPSIFSSSLTIASPN